MPFFLEKQGKKFADFGVVFNEQNRSGATWGVRLSGAMSGLRRRGVRWRDRNLFFGGVSAVEVRPDGALAAAGDPRRGGHGMVVG